MLLSMPCKSQTLPARATLPGAPRRPEAPGDARGLRRCARASRLARRVGRSPPKPAPREAVTVVGSGCGAQRLGSGGLRGAASLPGLGKGAEAPPPRHQAGLGQPSRLGPAVPAWASRPGLGQPSRLGPAVLGRPNAALMDWRLRWCGGSPGACLSRRRPLSTKKVHLDEIQFIIVGRR
jgi:hypothetical protein